MMIYTIKDPESGKILQRHTKMLKPFHLRTSTSKEVGLIYTTMLLLHLVAVTGANLFEYAPPLLIKETDRIVLDENGVEHYILNILFQDPCETILTNPTKCVNLDTALMLANASWIYIEK